MEYAAICILVVVLLVLLVLLKMMADQRKDLRHLDALDGALESLDVLKGLPESFRRLEERLESLRPPPAPEAPPPEPRPVEVKVDVADNLQEAVRAAVRGLERDVKKMLRITGRSRSELLGTRIERGLQNQGYTNVRITGGLPRTRSPKELSRVSVDAERDGARYRGIVTLRGNEIEETKLSPQTRMFP